MVEPLLTITFLAAAAIEMLLPIGLGTYLRRRYRVSWKVFLIGAVMFAVSLTRIPLNSAFTDFVKQVLTSNAVYWSLLTFPALTAGVFEEGVRYVAYRYIIRQRSWENSLMYGAGHGGLESMGIVGLSVLSTFILIAFFPSLIPPQVLPQLASMPAYMPLVGAYERMMAIIIQVGLSVLVLQCFLRNNVGYWFLSMGLHFIVDFAVIATVSYGIFLPEALATVFAAGFLWVIIRYGPSREGRQATAKT